MSFFWVAILCFFSFFLSSGTAFSGEQSNTFAAKNILVIVSDSLRFDALGCYGGEAKTPNIDWLAAHVQSVSDSSSKPLWTTS